MNFVPKSLLMAIAAALAAGSFAQVNPQVAEAKTKALMEAGFELRYSPDTVLVRFAPTATEARRANLVFAARAQRVEKFNLVPGLEMIYAPGGVTAALASLRNNRDVLFAEPNFVVKPSVTPNDSMYSSMWALRTSSMARINAPNAWNISTGDANFVVADIDTGAQTNHPDLQPNLWINPGEVAGNLIDDDHNGYVDDVNGWDFYANDNDPSDADGHGTHTAGTMGAAGNNSIGVTGVNWQCKIMPLRFMGAGGGLTSDAVRALNYAVAKGVKVSNNSWGGSGYSTSLYTAISNARSAGHIFVAAAGNDGSNNDSVPTYPASYNLDNIIAVAAIDSNGALASFSNYGATTVDLAAPGVNIQSTLPGNGYGSMSGTSMASPHVAGVVALLWSQHPSWAYGTVRTRILTTTRANAALAGKTATGGMLDAYDALNVAETAPTAPGTPSLLKTGNGTSRVTWADRSDNETGFEVQREKFYYYTWRGTLTIEMGANSTQVFDAPGVGYARYRVRSRNGAGVSAWTPWVQIKL